MMYGTPIVFDFFMIPSLISDVSLRRKSIEDPKSLKGLPALLVKIRLVTFKLQ